MKLVIIQSAPGREVHEGHRMLDELIVFFLIIVNVIPEHDYKSVSGQNFIKITLSVAFRPVELSIPVLFFFKQLVLLLWLILIVTLTNTR